MGRKNFFELLDSPRIEECEQITREEQDEVERERIYDDFSQNIGRCLEAFDSYNRNHIIPVDDELLLENIDLYMKSLR